MGSYATVVIRRGCLKRRVIDITILLQGVKDSDSKKVQMENANKGIGEATQMMIRILGFRPKLAAMVITRVKGIPCYVFIVTGEAP